MAALEVRSGITIPESDLHWRFSRSSGPGGQSVNTSDSRAELSVNVETAMGFSDFMRARALDRLSGRLVEGVLTVAAQENRSQLANREAALRRMRDLLREATAPPPKKRRPTKPSRGAVEARITEKKQRAQTKKQRRPPDSGW